ncbi:hypothetical protein TGAM01_v207509 [Trichoderma gamsii]|uniref:Uncharacterized protein n=1 Tax=Trichoderma gamsii TaxID=398673 RepID=A0A2P4ZGZ8_9HYPO|nr:hypothetical protein TGAM01_v207509 [Trichoderma gamsii]PON23565.1 hypothetical protein TGAM01_v207509 [Trichoderma gamsii]
MIASSLRSPSLSSSCSSFASISSNFLSSRNSLRRQQSSSSGPLSRLRQHQILVLDLKVLRQGHLGLDLCQSIRETLLERARSDTTPRALLLDSLPVDTIYINGSYKLMRAKVKLETPIGWNTRSRSWTQL